MNGMQSCNTTCRLSRPVPQAAIADGLERPFGTEDDGLPLDSLCDGIAASTAEVVDRLEKRS